MLGKIEAYVCVIVSDKMGNLEQRVLYCGLVKTEFYDWLFP